MKPLPQADLTEVDILDDALFVEGPPHELFARMRAEAPVRWNRLEDGGGVWSVTRHADIAAVSKDTTLFSSEEKGVFPNPDQVMPLEAMRNVILFKDPPGHTKYRLILQRVFSPRMIGHLEAGIRARVTRVLDEIVEVGECDFVSDVAVPIPLGVLCELMGVPEQDIPRFYDWTEQIEQAQRSPEPAAAVTTFGEMSVYLHEQIQAQTEADEETLVKLLREATVDGEQLDDVEILMFFGLLVFAGNDTTRNTTSSGMRALLEHPDQLAVVLEDPATIPNAIEEILRYTTVVNYFARTATADTDVGGQAIAAGDKLILWYTSASRDERVFKDPHRFDVSRPKPEHSAFGGGGRHFCLGAGMARLELMVIFEEVLRRLADVELAGEPEMLRSSWANSLLSLPVRFTPGKRESR